MPPLSSPPIQFAPPLPNVRRKSLTHQTAELTDRAAAKQGPAPAFLSLSPSRMTYYRELINVEILSLRGKGTLIVPRIVLSETTC